MARSRFLIIAAQTLLIMALALCSAAAFAQSAASWEEQDWSAVQTGDAASFAPCPAFACNCNRQTQANCNGGCIAATVTGCGPGGGFPCNGCR